MSRRRAGVTLIEMLVVIALTGVLLGLIGMMMNLLLRADKSGRDALSSSLNASRLSESFRHDVHLARAADLLPPPAEGTPSTGVVLRRDDGTTVQYRTAGDVIEREQKTGDDVKARDRFPLGAGSRPGFSRETADDLPFLSLHLGPAGEARRGTLTARLGRDLRFRSKGGAR